jgi:integrase
MDTTTLATTAGTTLATTALANPAAMYLAGLRGAVGSFAGSQRTQRHGLDRIARMLAGDGATAMGFAWATLSPAILAAVRARLVEEAAPATVNRLQSALKGTLRAAWQLGQIDADTRDRCLAVLKAVKARREPAGRHIDRGELAAMFDAVAADTTPAGARDGAMIALMAIGLRRAEVAGLDLADIDRTSWRIVVRGKGRADRVIFATNGCRAALEDWFAVRGGAEGPVFCPIRKGGHLVVGSSISTTTISEAMARRTADAGIDNARPHDLRRTFAGEALSAGVDVVTVAGLMGHANPATTARYDRRPDSVRAQACEAVSIPYRRRRTTAAA